MKKLLLGFMLGLLMVPAAMNLVIWKVINDQEKCVAAFNSEMQKMQEQGEVDMGTFFGLMGKGQQCMADASAPANKMQDVILFPLKLLKK